jgi:hypothetical protein
MSTLIESLAQERHAARYQAVTRASLDTRGGDASPLEFANKSASTRSRVGWLLIGLGLRLVARGGGGDAPARRASLLS